MAADGAGPEHPAAADPGQDTGHDGERPAAAPSDADGPDDPVGQDPAELDPGEQDPAGLDPGELDPGEQDPAGQDPAEQDPAEQDPAGLDPAEQDPGEQQARPEPLPGRGDGPLLPVESAEPDGSLFRNEAAPLPPPVPSTPPGGGDPDGIPRFLASLDFGPAAGAPTPAATHDRNRRALMLVSSVAAVAVAGMVGAFAALNTSPHPGPRNDPHPVASNGAMLATGSLGPNRFTPPYFGQPTTGAGNGSEVTLPRARTSAPPTTPAGTAPAPTTHRPSASPSTIRVLPSPSFPSHASCPPLPTLLRGAATDILCPLGDGSQG